jgi:hypothetical protein
LLGINPSGGDVGCGRTQELPDERPNVRIMILMVRKKSERLPFTCCPSPPGFEVMHELTQHLLASGKPGTVPPCQHFHMSVEQDQTWDRLSVQASSKGREADITEVSQSS